MRTIFRCSLLTAAFLLSGTAVRAQSEPITILGVTNAADFQLGLPERGSLASIFVTGLVGSEGTVLPTKYPLSNRLGNVEVWINFAHAPILAIGYFQGYQQINVQVPWGGDREPLYVEVLQYYSTVRRGHIEVPYEGVVLSDRSVFFVDGNGYGIMRHASDLSLVTPQNAAHGGEALIAYGINLGPVVNTPQDGVPTPETPVAAPGWPPFCSVAYSVLGSPAAVRLLPGAVGVYEIRFAAPSTTGEVPIRIGGTLARDASESCHSSAQHVSLYSRAVLLPIR